MNDGLLLITASTEENVTNCFHLLVQSMVSMFFAMKDQRSLSVAISGLTTWMRMSLFSRSSHVVFGRPLLSCCRHLHTTSGCDIVINLCIGCLHLLAIMWVFLLCFFTPRRTRMYDIFKGLYKNYSILPLAWFSFGH